MVTGAGGSIGSELCRQIIFQQPKALVLFELSEFALYAIHAELTKIAESVEYHIDIKPIIGSVQERSRIVTVMRAFNVPDNLSCRGIQACASGGIQYY